MTFEQALTEHFRNVEKVKFTRRDHWKAESYCGFLFSSSGCSKEILGNQAEVFERDVKATLRDCSDTDEFVEDVPVEALMGWKQGRISFKEAKK